MRVKFRKGEQRKFIDLVLQKLNCPSLRALNQFGFDLNYQTLKSYYNENRSLPEEFFKNLCHLGRIDSLNLDVKILDEHWGQRKRGRK